MKSKEALSHLTRDRCSMSHTRMIYQYDIRTSHASLAKKEWQDPHAIDTVVHHASLM